MGIFRPKTGMGIVIRRAKESDANGMYKLIKELAEYENAPNEVKITPEQLKKDGFGENILFNAFVADYNGSVIGMALFYPRYSTWKGKTLHLEDLVVTSKFRKHGIGKALFERVVLEAKKSNVQRMEWQVLDWNEPAIKFYKSVHSNFDNEWINCTFSVDQLSSYNFKTIK